MNLFFKKPLTYLFFFLIATLAIRTIYTISSVYLPFSPHIDVAIVNTLCAGITLYLSDSPLKRGKLFVSCIPAICIVVGSLILCQLSSVFIPEASTQLFDTDAIITSVLWIPIVEELVYRRGLSRFLVDKKSLGWSVYLSGLFFSMNHSLLYISDIPRNLVSIPLGPFLLGAICQYLVIYSGSLLGAILLHMTCNLSVFIFMYFDKRWLEWLSYIYLDIN